MSRWTVFATARRRRRLRSKSGRDALLRQPQGFEAALAIDVEKELRDLAVADVEQVRGIRANFGQVHSTRLAASDQAQEHQDTLVVELPILVDLGAVVLPGTQVTAPGLGHRGHPPPAAGRGTKISEHELDVGVRPLDRAE